MEFDGILSMKFFALYPSREAYFCGGKTWHGVCNNGSMKSEKLFFRSSPVSFTPEILESQVL